MKLSSDFRELLSAFSSARVRYLVVGGLAVVEYTEPRYTKDLDVWIDPAPANAARVFDVLKRFGAPLDGISSADFANPKLVYQMGVEPVRIDILMSLKGVRFDAAWESRTSVRWGRTKVNLISLDHLITNKSSVGRPQDILDVERLRAKKRVSRKRR
jgi:hypothetical protein